MVNVEWILFKSYYIISYFIWFKVYERGENFNDKIWLQKTFSLALCYGILAGKFGFTRFFDVTNLYTTSLVNKFIVK